MHEEALWPILATVERAGALLAQGRMYEWHWEMHPIWWGLGLGMMAMMLLFWAIVIIGLIIGIRWLLGKGREVRSDSALQILRERYARGEINNEEFEARKKDLL
jgi:putative membrane protein